jgi:hypothetical protein
MWETIREYIAAEVKLGIARERQRVKGTEQIVRSSELDELEQQSTRMETEVRRLIDLEQKQTAAAIRRASFGPPKLR